MSKAKFITLEGTEGVGKSTVQKFVSQYLQNNKKVNVVNTREPGGTPVAEKIRNLALHNEEEKIHPDTELLLMFAARAQHWNEIILPTLNKGTWVLSDRFIDASYAYQGGGRGIAFEKIASLEKLVLGDSKPDLVILLDAPVAVGMERARKRSAEDRFEKEREAFFERVREAYLKRAKADPGRYAIIDASQELDNVEQQLTQVLEAL